MYQTLVESSADVVINGGSRIILRRDLFSPVDNFSFFSQWQKIVEVAQEGLHGCNTPPPTPHSPALPRGKPAYI